MRKPGAMEIDACRRPTSVWVALGRSPVSSPSHPHCRPGTDNVTNKLYTHCGSIWNGSLCVKSNAMMCQVKVLFSVPNWDREGAGLQGNNYYNKRLEFRKKTFSDAMQWPIEQNFCSHNFSFQEQPIMIPTD